MNKNPGNHQEKSISNLRSPFSLKDMLKSIYFKLAPKGSKRYASSHIFIRKLLNARYHKWIGNFDRYSNEDLPNIIDQIHGMPAKPLISVIMPVFNPDLDYLNQAIQSVRDQIYPHWELCIADDASTQPGIQEMLQNHSLDDKRIKVQFRSTNGHISAASNTALAMASGEYVALLDHDDMLHPLALFFVVQEINAHPECVVIYSDEDKLTPGGKRIDPYFKSDFDYDLFLSQNMVSHLGVYKRDSLLKIDGFREGLEGSQDYDLLLRVLPAIDHSHIRHIPKVLYHWRISEQSVADSIDIKPYALDAGKRALCDYLAAEGVAAKVNVFENFGYKIKYSLSDIPPKVEIIIKSQMSIDNILRNCQTLINQTHYDFSRLTIKIITGEEKWSALKESLNIKSSEMQLTFKSASAYTTSSLSQMLKDSNADYVVFIDEHCSDFSPGWLEYLVSFADQPGVGCVSPKLVVKNGFIFSCGLILGSKDLAQYPFKGASAANLNHYFGWSSLHKGYSALPPHCMAIRRSDFLFVGGFNKNITNPTARHIELCLRMREAGFRNVVVPEAMVTLDQSRRPLLVRSSNELHISDADRQYLLERFRKWFEFDPAFNPNLILHKGMPVVSTKLRTEPKPK